MNQLFSQGPGLQDSDRPGTEQLLNLKGGLGVGDQVPHPSGEREENVGLKEELGRGREQVDLP